MINLVWRGRKHCLDGTDWNKTGNILRPAAPKTVTPLGRLAQATDPKTPTQLELWSNSNLANARVQDAVARARVDFGAELAGARFNELDLAVSEEAIWCYMRPDVPPSFTPTLLHELISMRRLLQRLFARSAPWRGRACEIFVAAHASRDVQSWRRSQLLHQEHPRARHRCAAQLCARLCRRRLSHDDGVPFAGDHHRARAGDALVGGFERRLVVQCAGRGKTSEVRFAGNLVQSFPRHGRVQFSVAQAGRDARAQEDPQRPRVQRAGALRNGVDRYPGRGWPRGRGCPGTISRTTAATMPCTVACARSACASIRCRSTNCAM